MTDEKAALDGLMAVCRLLVAAGMSRDEINDFLDRVVRAVQRPMMSDDEVDHLAQLLAAAALAAPTWEECRQVQLEVLREIGRDMIRRGFSAVAAKDAFERIVAAGRQAGEQMAQRGVLAGNA